MRRAVTPFAKPKSEGRAAFATQLMPDVRRQALRFHALTWAFPAEDVGKKPERVVKRRVDVEVGDSALTLGSLRVPYGSIQSAELQIAGVWPFRSYAIAMVVAEEIIVISVPASAAAEGFPFHYTERRLALFLPHWIFGILLLWLLFSLLVVVFLIILEYLTGG